MTQVNLYYHGGSKNHGCEAIIRSTNKILNIPLNLYSTSPKEDIFYGIDKVMDVKEDKIFDICKPSLKYYLSALNIKLFNSTVKNTLYRRPVLLQNIQKNDIYMSVGGDNYCYAGIEQLSDINYIINKKGAKSVLWGCSINPDIINKDVIDDLKRYSMIITRESITYKALKDKGIIDNVYLYPDPAFQLDKQEINLPKNFKENETIGINLSPLICDYEKNSGQTMKNYEALIKHIIDTTNYQIALVPHVIKEDSDDRKPLKVLYDKFKQTNRVILIDDANCMQLKYLISRCKMFIGARTHATIAAYSTCVPTLVVGYSIKAKGIAKDIFGTYENYVLPVQSLKKEDDLIKAYEWLSTNEKQIRTYLEGFMPGYCKKSLDAGKKVRELIK